MEGKYGEGKYLVANPDNSISISKDEPKKDEKFRFSIGESQSRKLDEDGKEVDIYYRWDSKGNYITYDTKEEYDDALSEYKKLQSDKEYKSIEDLDKKNLKK